MNVTEPLRRLALLRPEHPALIGHDGTTLSYEALDQLIDLVGFEADRRGLVAGDAVGLSIGGLEQFRALVVALGLARRGIATAAHHAPGVRLHLMVDGQAVPPSPPTGAVGVEPLARFWDGMAAGRADIPLGPIHADPEVTFRVFASSGTTGRPKLMRVSHGVMGRRVHDRWNALVPIPGVHAPAIAVGTSWGMTQALRTLWSGGTLVLSHTGALHDAILRHGVVSIGCAPVVLAEILAAMQADAPPPPSLRLIEVGGSRLPAKLRRQVEARLCKTIVSDCGSAESGGVASAPFALLDEVPGAVGYLHPGVRAEAVDEDDRVLPVGTEGLLRLRTVAPVAGYLGDAEATARQFRDGWFYPGDMGFVTAEGMLVLTGRANEVINAGGVKVAPGLIEQLLDHRPEIRESAAFGAPDKDGVVRVWAAVVAAEPVDTRALVADLRGRLGDRAPRFVLQLPSLPRNANGKVMRGALAGMVSGRR